MCVLPELEQDAAMDDMGAHLDAKAAAFMAAHPVNEDNVIQMHRRDELEQHCKPEQKRLDITVPVIALVMFAALLSFYWLIDHGLPIVGPLP